MKEQLAALPSAPAADHADVVHLAFVEARGAAGAPCLPPTRKVIGTKGQREVGAMHDVLICDPALSAEAWVTRCSWRFAHVPHVIYEEAETTCKWCLLRRLDS